MTEPGSDAAEGSPGAGSSTESDEESTDEEPAPRTDGRTGDSSTTSVEQSGPDLEEIRAAVEARYDFEDFGPADMDRMTPEEWEAVFDPDSWITGPELLDRVEADLKDRVRRRNLFARVEREDREGEDTVLAHTDTGYVIVRTDGSVMGEGSILREVEPVVAMCAMEDYEPPPMPSADEALLPHPDEVTSGSSELGNRIMLLVAGIQILAGLL
ncbi:MAG: hypothetical protein R3324_10655, partial [Halobacteriales archaeon]|nr:hypothetical protein [Halobacteriales archaeon]